MKLLKKIGIVLLVLLVLFVAAIFLVPQTFQVSVTQKIDSKPSTLYNIVSNVTLEKYWNPWQQQDTTMKSTYGEITKGEGASYSWESKKMGSGRAEQVESIKNQKIVTNLDFGSMGEGVANHIFEEDGQGTNMTWTLESKTTRPNNLMNILIKGEVKRSYRKGMERAESESFSTRRALVVDYYGDPAGTTIVHDAIDEYMADRDLHFDWPVVEEYVTDPADEPNQEKWLTRVIYYLSE